MPVLGRDLRNQIIEAVATLGPYQDGPIAAFDGEWVAFAQPSTLNDSLGNPYGQAVTPL